MYLVFTIVFCTFVTWFANGISNYEYTITISNAVGVGRRFDGIGGISGGGATSKLLPNYQQKQRDEILDFLFKPNFGASLHILKVEIGGDGQSTDGTEASHMHTKDEENYHRGYEWWLMKEAKKRNPSILIYGLPWTFPGWVGKGPYTNPGVTADYVVRWVQAARKIHNITVDYVGIWNERPYDKKYIEILRSTLDSRGLQHVKIVAADVKWEIADEILKDAKLAATVSIVGGHYPGTTSSHEAVATNKPLWASEDYSTYNDDVGAGCWARILNQNYVNGNMTSTIAWNLVASYYKGLPYYRDGLMTADQPWGGHYTVNDPVWVTAHTSQFAFPGWHYLRHGRGAGHLQHGGSYVSLVHPVTHDLTIVIETMTWSQSICIRPFLPVYVVKPQKVIFNLEGSLKSVDHLHVWYTKLHHSVFKKLQTIKVVNASFTLSLGLDEIYTLTTLNRGSKGEYPSSPVSKPFPLPYVDTFQDYPLFSEPYNFAQQMGSFEIVNASRGKVLRQMVQQPPVHWCDADTHRRTYSVVGDHTWTDLSFTVDVNTNVEANGAVLADGAFVGIRATKGGCDAGLTRGIFLFIFPKKHSYVLSTDLSLFVILKSGNIKMNSTWNTVGIHAVGNVARGWVNGEQIFTITSNVMPSNGFAAFGTHSFGLADFRNARIQKGNADYRSFM